MDPWKSSESFFPPPPPVDVSGAEFHCSSSGDPYPPSREQSQLGPSCQKVEQEIKDSIAARKVQKADREKLKRDRLNEQFMDLGKALDPDRPKNDKATILTDAIQVLKDLTAQVNRMKAEYASLSEESRELMQEKNELREEKTTLKADIDNLNVQYQQRLRAMYPWASMDPSVVLGPPPPYSFPMPVPISSGPIPMHPAQHPYPFYRNQSPGTIPNPYSMYMFCSSSPASTQVEQLPNQRVGPHHHPCSSNSQTASRHDSRNTQPDDQQQTSTKNSDDFNDVATELELKTPGSAAPSHLEATHDKDSCSKKRKQLPPHRKGCTSVTEASSSSRCSSVLPDSSTTSPGDGTVTDNQLNL